MACFIVPLAQAVVTTAYRRLSSSKSDHYGASIVRQHLTTLEKMLWGGSVMLIVDHAVNGELTWRFPFLTALNQIGGEQVVLQEMLYVGLPMSVALTAVWGVYVWLKARQLKKAEA